MKAPAFNFYYRDFLHGVGTMDLASVGAYIKLICMQADKGYVTDHDIVRVCTVPDYENATLIKLDDVIEAVKDKFTLIDGKYINERLDGELKKRKAYSESRRANRSKKTKQVDAPSKKVVVEKSEKHDVRSIMAMPEYEDQLQKMRVVSKILDQSRWEYIQESFILRAEANGEVYSMKEVKRVFASFQKYINTYLYNESKKPTQKAVLPKQKSINYDQY